MSSILTVAGHGGDADLVIWKQTVVLSIKIFDGDRNNLTESE